MSPADQQKFLDHFSVLNTDQQTYANNQFLSTPPEIQKHAINQFLSLDPEVLIVSIQAEIEKEPTFSQPRDLAQETLQTRQQSQRTVSTPRRTTQSRNPNQPREAERKALQRQLLLQKLQLEQLQQIFEQQKSINLRRTITRDMK